MLLRGFNELDQFNEHIIRFTEKYECHIDTFLIFFKIILLSILKCVCKMYILMCRIFTFNQSVNFTHESVNSLFLYVLFTH